MIKSALTKKAVQPSKDFCLRILRVPKHLPIMAALEYIQSSKQHTYDVILLDWMLPELSGIEVCKTIRHPQKGNFQGGVIFLTAKSGLDDCVAALDSGADDYITKPFEIKELIARIKAVSRPLDYAWVKNLYQECVAAGVTFCFIETGTDFIKDGKTYHMPDKRLQSEMAYKSGLQYQGKRIDFELQMPQDLFGEGEIYHKHFRDICQTCGSRLICNGCSDCGLCQQKKRP